MATGITKAKWLDDTNIIDSKEVFAEDLNFEISYNGKTPAREVIDTPPTQDYKNIYSQSVNNRLFYGDNLDVLRHLIHKEKLKEKVKLVYIDPPYGTNSVFQSRNQKSSYRDDLVGSHYIEFLRKRLILLRELLSKEGSIYVHLDGNMVFQIKVIMDEIFGAKNFRGFITRKKCSNKNSTRNTYGNISDYIIFYSKTDKYTWVRATEPWPEDKIIKEYNNIDEETGRRYKKVPIHAPGTRNGETGKPWKGRKPPAGKHWQYTPAKLTEMDNNGEIYWSSNGNPRRKIFFDKDKGIPVQDIWLDVQDSLNQSIKITGYPTEKNPYLLERIINASTNEGDIVLDCFNGSGTTIDLADQLGRKFIGIDNSLEAIKSTIKRFYCGLEEMGDYVTGVKKTSNSKRSKKSNAGYNPNLLGRKNFNVVCDEEHLEPLQNYLEEVGLSKSMNTPFEVLNQDPILNQAINLVGRVKLKTRSADKAFDYLVESIISQQLSIKAADSIISKVRAEFGNNYDPKKLLSYSIERLRKLGVSARKASFVHALSEEVVSKSIDFEHLQELSNEEVITALTKIKGIGKWTAKMYLIFVLGRENVFPHEDKAFSEQIKELYPINGFKNIDEKMNFINVNWSPFQSYGALYMWKIRDEKIQIQTT